jgi:hypothetical protein
MRVSIMLYLCGVVAIGLVGLASIFYLFGLEIPASERIAVYLISLATEILALALWSEITTIKARSE